MIQIIFEAHSTSLDNESHKSSGHFDVDLSELGVRQSHELGERYKDQRFEAIFCSDLLRSYKTAEIAFGDKFKIIKDSRLRECDYGDLTQYPSEEVDKEKINHLDIPFPKGESYNQCLLRMKKFLEKLLEDYDGKKIMIIGHRATQYGLEYWINGKPIEELVNSQFKWQPGWSYKLQNI